MIPMSLTQTAPTPTIIKGGLTYHLDSTAIIKNGRPFTIDPKAIKSKGTIFSINPSAFKNAKNNVYTLVSDAVISKSEGILTPDPTAFVKDNKCYTIDPTAMIHDGQGSLCQSSSQEGSGQVWEEIASG